MDAITKRLNANRRACALWACCTLAIVLIAEPSLAARLFVDVEAGRTGSGTTWEDASVDLQPALDSSSADDEPEWPVPPTCRRGSPIRKTPEAPHSMRRLHTRPRWPDRINAA